MFPWQEILLFTVIIALPSVVIALLVNEMLRSVKRRSLIVGLSAFLFWLMTSMFLLVQNAETEYRTRRSSSGTYETLSGYRVLELPIAEVLGVSLLLLAACLAAGGTYAIWKKT